MNNSPLRIERIKHIYNVDGSKPFMHAYASNPIPYRLSENLYRIYFSSRNNQNQSYICSLTFDMEKMEVVEVETQDEPHIGKGEKGLFDDSGTSGGCVVNVDGDIYLYYLGWSLCKSVPFKNFPGLAIQKGGEGKFEKYSRVPVMDRIEIDPFSMSYPFVLKDGDIYRAWYGSHLEWGEGPLNMQHVLKYAESTDAKNWKREGHIAINLESDDEDAISRPCVLKRKDGTYEMWYSIRYEKDRTYRIGYALSADAVNWERKDELVNFDVSEEGWDSEMICYPFVFEHDDRKFLLYNGNEYGKTGFGIAEIFEN